MPNNARGVRREHVESFLASRRDKVKPASQSVEFRALQQFWKWALDEGPLRRGSASLQLELGGKPLIIRAV